MKDLDPRSAARIEGTTAILARALGLIAGFAMLAISIWGFKVADEVGRPLSGPADPAAAFQHHAAPLEFWATWLVLFFPIALLGLWILKATLRGSAVHRWLHELMGREGPEKRPHTPAVAVQHASPASASLVRQSDPLTDMPEDVREAILNRATTTAQVLGLFSGSVLVLLGVAGVVTGVVAGFFPSESSGGYSLGTLRLVATWVVASGLALLIGTKILRSTLAGTGEKPGWLFPLRLFMMIVQEKIVSGREPVIQQPKRIKAGTRDAGTGNKPS
jgi:hypothetical protein